MKCVCARGEEGEMGGVMMTSGQRELDSIIPLLVMSSASASRWLAPDSYKIAARKASGGSVVLKDFIGGANPAGRSTAFVDRVNPPWSIGNEFQSLLAIP